MSVIEIFLPMLLVFMAIKVGQRWIDEDPIREPETSEIIRTFDDFMKYFDYEVLYYTPSQLAENSLMGKVFQKIGKFR